MILNLNIDDLRNEFENLKKIRLDIIEYFDILSNKIELVTSIYGKYIKQLENKGTIFGLDALHFQTFLINFEYDNMKKMYILIENKLYCEYYKLFKLMVNYNKSTIDDDDVLKVCENKSKYPVYKDLEQYKIYDFEIINSIHDDILILLDLMNKFIIKKEKELEVDETNSLNGLNLHIVVNTIDFNITLLKQKLKLYINYLKSFHKYHITYLSRLSIKIGIMCGQINKDIKLERASTPTQNENFTENNKLKQSLRSYPSLTNLQQEELNSFIETENVTIKDELNEIIINMSDSGDSDREKIDENNSNNSNVSEEDKSINEYVNENTNVTTSENNINILFIDNNIIMKQTEYDKKEDIGDMTNIELKERWETTIQETKKICELKTQEEGLNEVSFIEETECNIENVENDQDEINKWREIIINKHMTNEEKLKEKTKLKRIRYKNNKDKL